MLQFALKVMPLQPQVPVGQSQVISTVLPLQLYSSVLVQAPPEELEPLWFTNVQVAPESVRGASVEASAAASVPGFPEDCPSVVASGVALVPLSSEGVFPELLLLAVLLLVEHAATMRAAKGPVARSKS